MSEGTLNLEEVYRRDLTDTYSVTLLFNGRWVLVYTDAYEGTHAEEFYTEEDAFSALRFLELNYSWSEEQDEE